MDFRSLNQHIQSSSLTVAGLAAGILLPMIVKLSKEEEVHQQHTPTLAGPPAGAGNLSSMDVVGMSSNDDKLAALLAYFIVVLGFFLFALIFPSRHHPPGRRRYIAFKILLHTLSILLVCLSFSFSLTMRMNILATSSTLFLAAIYVGHRLWQSTATALDTDLEVYGGSEEEINQLLETSTAVASIMFTGWFGMASSESEEAHRDARFLASRYLVFFTSVAASLVLVKAFPRRLSPSLRPVRELRALVCVLVAAVDTTALAIAASEVGLVPEAIALAVGCAQ